MAKTVKTSQGANISNALKALAKERQESGLTLSDKQLDFIVSLVKSCAG